MVTTNIMVVEDERVVARDIKNCLEDLGFTVNSMASSGEEAVTNAGEDKPDLILMDIKLHGDLDGIAAAEQIMSRFNIPVVFLSAFADQELLKRAGKTGSYGYLVKPFENRELHATIEMALYKSKMDLLLRQNEERFRLLYQNSPLGYQSLDGDGRVIEVNPAWLEMLGYSREEVVGKWFGDFLAPQQADLFKERFSRFKNAGASSGVQFRMVCKDREEIDVEFDGKIGYDENGNFKQTHCIMRDITKRKQMEDLVKMTMTNLKRSNTELDQFASVVSHDLQEPLRVITGFSGMLKNRLGDELDSDAKEFIHFIIDGGERMQKLISDMLAYSRLTTRGKEFLPVNCETLFKDVLNNLLMTIDETSAEVTHETLPTVEADETQMVQLLQNLIANAIKFRGKEVPRVHVVIADKEDEWLFSIKDNGIGIEARHQERVFDIFQRLHSRSEYPGTGIGLAVCKKIIERHGGRIYLESEPGKGTTVFFTLPKRR
jgi:PAS domain S-box-containing protein